MSWLVTLLSWNSQNVSLNLMGTRNQWINELAMKTNEAKAFFDCVCLGDIQTTFYHTKNKEDMKIQLFSTSYWNTLTIQDRDLVQGHPSSHIKFDGRLCDPWVYWNTEFFVFIFHSSLNWNLWTCKFKTKVKGPEYQTRLSNLRCFQIHISYFRQNIHKKPPRLGCL